MRQAGNVPEKHRTDEREQPIRRKCLSGPQDQESARTGRRFLCGMFFDRFNKRTRVHSALSLFRRSSARRPQASDIKGRFPLRHASLRLCPLPRSSIPAEFCACYAADRIAATLAHRQRLREPVAPRAKI